MIKQKAAWAALPEVAGRGHGVEAVGESVLQARRLAVLTLTRLTVQAAVQAACPAARTILLCASSPVPFALVRKGHNAKPWRLTRRVGAGPEAPAAFATLLRRAEQTGVAPVPLRLVVLGEDRSVLPCSGPWTWSRLNTGIPAWKQVRCHAAPSDLPFFFC